MTTALASQPPRKKRDIAPWPAARPWLLVLPAFAVLLPVYLVPVGRLLLLSFGTTEWSLVNYRQALGDPNLLRILYRTLVLAAEVTAITLLLGYPLAYMIATSRERAQRWLLIVLAMPLWTSALVRSFAWIVLLGRQGLVNEIGRILGLWEQPIQLLYGRSAVLIGFVHVMLPYVVFSLVSIMKRVPPRLFLTGTSLGASCSVAFWLVFFPMTLPGVVSAAVLTFILTVGYFVTPALLGGLGEITYVMFIQQQVDTAMNWPLAAAMSVVLLVVMLVTITIFYRFLRVAGEGNPLQETLRENLVCNASRHDLLGLYNAKIHAGRLRKMFASRGSFRAIETGHCVRMLSGAILLFILIPILILFPLSLSGASFLQFPPPSLSFRWYVNFLSRSDWLSAAIVSFEVASAVMVVVACLGAAAAVGVSRLKGGLSSAICGVLISPMIIPHILIAIAIYFQFAKLHLIGSLAGLVFAHCVIAFPVVFIIMEAALRRVNLGPERAALSLGAGPIRAFVATTLRAIRPSLVTAALFAFLTSFDDVVIALFISGINETLPKRMWDGVTLEIDPTVAAASTLLVALSICVVVAIEFAGLRRQAEGHGESAGGP